MFDGVTFSIMKTIGMKYIMPITFWTNVIVKGLYNNVNFLKEIEYATATITALNKKMMPFTDTVNSKFLLRSMNITPKNEMMKPAMFHGVSLSFRKKNAAIGVKSGIVAMMAELTTGAELSNP
jgi:hypothetical protein